jgi:hypothetical protein
LLDNVIAHGGLPPWAFHLIGLAYKYNLWLNGEPYEPDVKFFEKK